MTFLGNLLREILLFSPGGRDRPAQSPAPPEVREGFGRGPSPPPAPPAAGRLYEPPQRYVAKGSKEGVAAYFPAAVVA